MNNNPTQIPTIRLNLEIPEKGDWQHVRTWLDGAKGFEECRLACLVMVGFHLLELHKQHGVKAGRPGNSANVAELNWPDLIAEQTRGYGTKGAGLSETSGRRCMAMAEAVKPRLKKLPALKSMDLLNTPVSGFDREQRDALFAGVNKLVDGRSQLDFMNELGLVKLPQGSGATGGGPGGKKKGEPATQAEAEEALRQMEREQWGLIDKTIFAYADKWHMRSRFEIEAQAAFFEKEFKVREKFLKGGK